MHLPLWGGQKIDLELFELRSIDLHSINSWNFERGVDKVGGKDDVEGTVHDHLKDLVETNAVVVDHQAVAKFLALPQPTLDANLHGIKKIC